ISFFICAFCALIVTPSLEDEPPAYLHATWLEDVGVACRDAEVDVVDVEIRKAEAPTIEKVEELRTYFEVSGFSNLRFLHETKILSEERLRAQTSVRRRGGAEEPIRIRIISDVRRIHCDSAVERERRPVAEIERA